MGANTSSLSRVEASLTALAHRLGVTRLCRVERAVRAAEFGAVGLSGAFVNVALLLALLGHVPSFEAAFVAFFTAAVWTFALNSHYTFDETDRTPGRFARYLCVCALGYVAYALVLTASVAWLALPHWLAAFPAVAVGGLLNYVGSERFALA